MKKILLMAMAIFAMNAVAQEMSTKPFTIRYIDENVLYQRYVALAVSEDVNVCVYLKCLFSYYEVI